MSRETDMAEEKKMLEFLSANGITTLEQLKDIFRHWQNKAVDGEVVFVKEIKPEAASCISQEMLNMLIEASTRNKEILLNDLSKNSAGTSDPQPVAQQSGTIDVPGQCVENAGCTNKNVTTLPMRYRHKHSRQNHPIQKEIKCQQQRERSLKACEGDAHQENIQYNQYQQHNYHVHNQNGYEGVGQNIPGCNNGSGLMITTWPCSGDGINSIDQTIPVTQPLASTTVYTVVPQQQWSSVTSMAHTGHSGYNSYAQFHLDFRASRPPATQYMMGSGPVYNTN